MDNDPTGKMSRDTGEEPVVIEYLNTRRTVTRGPT